MMCGARGGLGGGTKLRGGPRVVLELTPLIFAMGPLACIPMYGTLQVKIILIVQTCDFNNDFALSCHNKNTT